MKFTIAIWGNDEDRKEQGVTRMDAIELTVDRQKRYIPVDRIRYIRIDDKLCNFYLKNEPPIQIFISITEVERKLPPEEFVRVSRNLIVAYAAIQSIRDTIQLFNHEELNYSVRRKTDLLKGYRSYIERVLLAGKVDEYEEIETNRFKKDYKCFDTMPVPFAIIELVVNADHQSTDFIFRYANKALSVLENVTLEEILDHSFYKEFSTQADSERLEFYEDIAFHGGYKEKIIYSRGIEKMLRVQCFQPYYGYCGCILTDISGEMDAESHLQR
ncbi:MAG: LytTR family DNA-binding domain-containing protein [Lachnospiraceae bacterium]|nr:LytTR family DNA-binding domain-containing protein [Lachnospiraceae bacterium]